MEPIQGNVSIDAQNIMPIIKKWLYSDKDIFIREVVSNGCDAITKLRMVDSAAAQGCSIHVEVDTRSLLQSIDRVSLIISEKLKSPLRCIFGDGMVSITTRTSIGDAADQCPVTGDGQGLEIGFNNKYLMDALKNAPADRLRLEFTSGVAPCVILPAEGEKNFIYMVLPVRLKAN